MSETPTPSNILRYFTYDHLPAGEMRRISAIFGQVAHQIDDALPGNAEKATALRKLLEAKDAAVRAALDIPAKSPEGTPGTTGHYWPCPLFYVTEVKTARCTCSRAFEVR